MKIVKNNDKAKQIIIICISAILMLLYFNYRVEISDFELYEKLIVNIIIVVLILILICLYTYINNKSIIYEC